MPEDYRPDAPSPDDADQSQNTTERSGTSHSKGEPIDNGKRLVQETRIRADVTAEEYKQALQTLNDFASVDVGGVSNVDELSQVTSGIGPALRAVIISHPDAVFQPGKMWREQRDGVEQTVREDAKCNLDKELREGRIHLEVSQDPLIGQEFVWISVHPGPPLDRKDYGSDDEFRRAYYSGYWVKAFADKPVQPTGDDMMDRTMHAVEPNEAHTRRIWYEPLAQPNNPDAQRGYVRILQTCVRDVLALNPSPPTPIPPGILQAFGDH